MAASVETGAVLFAVPLLADAGRTVRINISLDKALVDRIDAAAAARGLTRSAFLAQAAREKIGRLIPCPRTWRTSSSEHPMHEPLRGGGRLVP